MTTTQGALASWTAHLPKWIPHSLDELHGPGDGIVELPLIVCWSGCNTFDLASFRQRMAMYETVIVQGSPDHYKEFLNRDHLLDAWPLLHRFLGHGYMQAWEDRFSELARLGASEELRASTLARYKESSWAA